MGKIAWMIGMSLLITLSAMGCSLQSFIRLPPTGTPIPTSEPPYDPPKIFAPEDGAIIEGDFPDFQLDSPARSWTIHIIIFNDTGYQQEVILGVGAYFSGWMNSMYTPAPPMPLAPGTYQWVAYGCRETAVGGCGPQSETRTFTIK